MNEKEPLLARGEYEKEAPRREEERKGRERRGGVVCEEEVRRAWRGERIFRKKTERE
jgi:hypothetical protein